MERGCQQNDSLVNGQAEEMETSLEFADELFGSPQPDGKALPLPRVSTVFVAMANDRKALPFVAGSAGGRIAGQTGPGGTSSATHDGVAGSRVGGGGGGGTPLDMLDMLVLDTDRATQIALVATAQAGLPGVGRAAVTLQQ